MANSNEIVVSPIETEQDIEQAVWCLSESFGRQTSDSLWMSINPGWDTEQGRKRNAESMIKRWKSVTTNNDGQLNAIYLKATILDQKTGERRVAGVAIWSQLSFVDGYGVPFDGDMSAAVQDLDEKNKRFAMQMFHSLFKRRVEYCREVSASDRQPPAIFVLDLCGVDPAYQRRGIAAKLVQYGLEEAKKRGNLECTTEGSAMGRHVYRRLGFKDEGTGDIEFEVDDEFKDWDKPSNVFLRTGA
ncbi:Importin subunit beta-2 [Sphaceloma murrayae]|uniref:Importin subunit beta-2 n=1 Tax=Sphaceloma murrayae TaxID=2082308 RepID=A0A2K1QPV9_9PEZI|nr:Importin subunit beta-2 [Sphaceloma murrayae]